MTPGWYEVTAKTTHKDTGNDIADWDLLKASMNNADKKWVKEFGKEGQKHFIVALHSDDLNNTMYLDINKDMHTQWLV